MDEKISSQDYEIMKDGVIVAEADDIITFKFKDIKCSFIIKDSNEKESDEKIKPEISEDKKLVKLRIFTSWDNLNTTFPRKESLVLYTDEDKKRNYILHTPSQALKGADFKAYIYGYTLYPKDLPLISL